MPSPGAKPQVQIPGIIPRFEIAKVEVGAGYFRNILDRVFVLFRKGENERVFTKQKQNNDPYGIVV